MKGKTIGYARVSTRDQNLDAQLDQLKAAGVEKIFSEKKSGKDADRPQLALMLDFVREGDVVVVTKLDRIARSTADLLNIVQELEGKGVGFKALNADIDTTSATGKLMLTVLGAIATFERELMLERQAEGIAKAKEAGRYKGRKPTAREKADKVLELAKQGMTRQAIADELGISVASVYRILRDDVQ